MELVRKSRTLPREQEPGEKFAYSNTNYMPGQERQAP